MASGEWLRVETRKACGQSGCGRCHTCGEKLDIHDFCPKCKRTRRYICHGYVGDDHDSTPCPRKEAKQAKR